ncbi:MAG TPA: metallophosphoesterase [Candidatus Binatia bacterium]|nr:metallophosphoesterase [Candidatus Binatia bacterium]
MRIVSFGDIHMSLHTIERLGPELSVADLVILSGDLTNYGGRDDAVTVLAATRRHARAVLAVCGNLDMREVIDLLDDEGISLHGDARRIGDLGIFGCGGSNVTPLRTPTELSEAEIAALLERGHARVADAPHRLMVCHTPPIDSATDRLLNGEHVGSPAVRRFIEMHQPEVCITGHIHESAGVDRIGATVVLNAGAFREGGYIVVDDANGALHARLTRLSAAT